MLAALLSLALAANGETPAPETPTATEGGPRTSVFIGAAGGAGAGVSVIPPVPYALPWLEVQAGFDRRIGERWFVDGRLDLSIGPSAEGGTIIGGYGGLLELGRDWFDTGLWRAASYGRLGVISFTLVPLPLLGIGHSLELAPVRGEIFRWSTGIDFNLDFVLLPVFSGGAWTTLAWRFGDLTLALRLKGSWGASILKGVGVSAGARASAAWHF